jgi:hypothetical protein
MLVTGIASLLGAFTGTAVVFGKTSLLLAEACICASTALLMFGLIASFEIRIVLAQVIILSIAGAAITMAWHDEQTPWPLLALSALPGIGLVVSGIAAFVEWRKEVLSPDAE